MAPNCNGGFSVLLFFRQNVLHVFRDRVVNGVGERKDCAFSVSLCNVWCPRLKTRTSTRSGWCIMRPRALFIVVYSPWVHMRVYSWHLQCSKYMCMICAFCVLSTVTYNNFFFLRAGGGFLRLKYRLYECVRDTAYTTVELANGQRRLLLIIKIAQNISSQQKSTILWGFCPPVHDYLAWTLKLYFGWR